MSVPSSWAPAPSEIQTLTSEFDGLEIRWDRRVLEPRLWTADQARWAAELAQDAPAGPILELCCGAGQIGLLAARLSGRSLVQVDLDEVAGEYARQNATAAGIDSEVRVAPMSEALGAGEVFPLVVADPPWVTTARVVDFPEDPILAVDGGTDGLVLVRAALGVALDHLMPSGHVVLQVGDDAQADRVEEAFGGEWPEVARNAVTIERRRYPRGMLMHLSPGPA